MGYNSSADDSGEVYVVVCEAERLIVVFLLVISDGAVMTQAQHSAIQ
jgi:hypothetical protein